MIKNENSLIKQKHNLIRSYEKKEINNFEYESRLKELDKQIDDETQSKIKTQKEEYKVKEQMVEKNKDVSKVKDKKIGRKEQKDSYASVIAKVLSMKTVKDIDSAVVKVTELKPGRDAKKIKAQTVLIINEAVKGKGRWKNYTWNKDNFLLTEKA